MASVLVSCANIGRPSGGPRDETPPVYVSSNPEPNQLNFSGSKITINFNEYIQLKDQTTKVVVSPAQKNMPIIRANGKSVSVELRDTLLPNTTYCIDFADAIQDNNESNPLNDFAFAFSTGDSIDSLQVSGIMLRASDLEPMQGIIVGIHENLNDSAFSSILPWSTPRALGPGPTSRRTAGRHCVPSDPGRNRPEELVDTAGPRTRTESPERCGRHPGPSGTGRIARYRWSTPGSRGN